MHTHTPGPWTCHPTLTPEYDDDPMGCYTVEPAASSLQERFDKADFDSEILEPIQNENRANALLIAAAPDLLEALKAIHSLYNVAANSEGEIFLDESEIGAIAARAIAKATIGG